MSERPLSPHLQVYKPQLTSVMSILHRGTGVVMALGLVFVVYYIYAVSQGAETFSSVQDIANTWYGTLILLGLLFSLFYHLGNGIRHLAWDMGWGFELPRAYATGWTVIVFSVAATVATAWLMMGGAA